MAERGAHLSQLLLDSSRPSIFELVAQEGLNQALRGTIKFIFRVHSIYYMFLLKYFHYTNFTFQVCANHYPETFGLSFRWANEIQLLFDCFLQNYYLRNYGLFFIFISMNRIYNNIYSHWFVCPIFFRCFICRKFLWVRTSDKGRLQFEWERNISLSNKFDCPAICIVKIRCLLFRKATEQLSTPFAQLLQHPLHL